MKRSFAILISATALISLACVAVRAEDATDAVNANANINAGTETSVNSNTNAPANDNANTNTNVNANVPVPTLYTEPASTENLPPSPPPIVNAPTGMSNSEMMKILTPEHIKFFTNIKKIGNSLFGMMKKGAKLEGGAANAYGQQNKEISNNAQNTPEELEKILSPDMIKFFTNIKKIGNSLFGNRVGGKPVEVKRPIVTAETSACVISAIGVKDAAVVAAKNAETTSFTTAVTARTACQTVALGSIDGQPAALAKCAVDFRKAAEGARQTFAKAQKATWETYVAALKACKPAAAPAESIMIEDGADGQ